MSNIFQEFELTLQHIRKQCHAIPLGLQGLKHSFTIFAPLMLLLRLQLLRMQVLTQALSLYISHTSKGLVFLMKIPVGLVVFWTEKEDILADVEDLRKQGILILAIDEFSTAIGEMETQLRKGKIAEVVKQVNNLNLVATLE